MYEVYCRKFLCYTVFQNSLCQASSFCCPPLIFFIFLGNQHTMEETLANLVLERNCRLCRQNVANVVIMPCGHLVLCSNCSKNNVTKCPVCKSMVTELIKTFLA